MKKEIFRTLGEKLCCRIMAIIAIEVDKHCGSTSDLKG